jgi:hypothetical protein
VEGVAVKPRDLFGVVVRTLGLIALLTGTVQLIANGLDILRLQQKFSFTIPLTIGQLAALLGTGLGALICGIALLFGAGFVVRLVYGREIHS